MYDDDSASNRGSAYIFEKPTGGWTSGTAEIVKLAPSLNLSNHYFGRTVDICNDWVIVGGKAAYTFKKPATGWGDAGNEEVILTQSDPMGGDNYSESVSISDTAALVSAHGVDDVAYNAGAVYFFHKSADDWSSETVVSETVKKLPYYNILNNGEDQFGASVDIDGDFAVVGSPGYYFNTGRVHVLGKNPGGWDTLAILTASDAEISHSFGSDVIIHGNLILIGAKNASGNTDYSGAVYYFEKQANGWATSTETGKLFASDGTNWVDFGNNLDYFPDDSLVIVGCERDNNGSAYIFKNTGGTWNQLAKLTASDGASGDIFGHSVAISKNTALVGAYKDDDGGPDAGSAYIFEMPGSGWADMTETAKLTASNPNSSDYFGSAVDVSDSIAVIGAPGEGEVASGAGMIYLFRKPGGGWINSTETAKLTSNDADVGENLGDALDMDEDVILAGSYRRDVDTESFSGGVYIFTMPEGGWVDGNQDSILVASDPLQRDYFGQSVAFSGNQFIVGAPGVDDNGASAGAVYIFEPGMPEFTRQPLSLINICNADSVLFTVETINADSIHWQASIDGGALFSDLEDDAEFSGATDDTLMIFHPASHENKLFRCRIKNNAGEVYSDTVHIIIDNIPPIPDGDTLTPFLGNTCATITKIPTATSCNEKITGTTSSPLSYSGQGEYSITWNYEDSYGNTSSQIQHVILHDSIGIPRYEEKQEIIASNAFENGMFGYSVDIDSNYMIVGSKNLVNEGNGYVYIFEKQGQDWQEIAMIEKPGSKTFGNSVCIHDNKAFVGDPKAKIGVDKTGKVYVLENVNGNWQMTDSIKSMQPDLYEFFGSSIACSDNHLLVGARGNDDKGSNAGCLHVFELYNDQIYPKKTLYSPEPKAGALYGSSVSIDGDYAVIGAPEYNIGASQFKGTGPSGHGIAVVCKSSGFDMQEIAFIRASDHDNGSKFGQSVSIDGEWIAVGAYNQNDSGAVYLYKKPNTGWQDTVESQKIKSNTKSAFGYAVDMQNDQLVIGASYSSEYKSYNGRAYVYELNNDMWNEYASFNPVEISQLDYFGSAVALDGDNIIAGAKGDDDAGSYTGALYRFASVTPCLTKQPTVFTGLCGQDTVLLTIAGDHFDSIQWQYAAGIAEPFINIPQSDTFNGVNNDSLQVITTPDYSQYFYRCKVINGMDYIFSDTVQIGLENVNPTFVCQVDTSVDADASDNYTVSGTLLDPTDIDDNCEIDTMYNDINFTNSLNGSIFGTGTHTITWHIIDVSGNHDSCSFDLTVDEYVSIEYLARNGIRVYPNPFDDHIVISNSLDKTFHIELQSITGSLLMKSKLNNKGQVELSNNYKPGMYILKINNNETKYVVKMIKK
jgi:hypothetical protein